VFLSVGGFRTCDYTFDETRGYQLCHYDVVVAQPVATCFIKALADSTASLVFPYLPLYVARWQKNPLLS
jgi:hypothetical protein